MSFCCSKITNSFKEGLIELAEKSSNSIMQELEKFNSSNLMK